MIIYGSDISGNCLKVKWTADLLGLDYEWAETNILQGETRTPEFLALSPAGQIPIVTLNNGKVLEQSCAIILYLAEISGSVLLPSDPYAKAKMIQWLFWEQNSLESSIAVRRFRKHFLKMSDAELDPALLAKGNECLQLIEDTVSKSPFIHDDQIGLPDIAIVAYTRMADEGGFNLKAYPQIQNWITRVEGALNIPPYTGSLV